MESGAARLNKKSRKRLQSRQRTAILPPKNFSESLEQHPHLNPLSAPPSRDPKADAEARERCSGAHVLSCRVPAAKHEHRYNVLLPLHPPWDRDWVER